MSKYKQLLFFSKCRPGVDAWQVCEKYRRVFIGYPIHEQREEDYYKKEIVKWREIGFKNIFISLTDENWNNISKHSYGSSYDRQVTTNRNLALSVDEGSIVLVPRPGDGACYAGVINNRFELADNPAWADDYINLVNEKKIVKTGESADYYLGDVVYSWSVEEWKTLSFAAIPRWISYRLLSRTTVGIISDLKKPEEVSAINHIKTMMGLDIKDQYKLLQNSNMEITLLNWVSPTVFEHLVVELLQLENSNSQYWHHVGGSGDGGVDGIGLDDKGRVTALLQCKLHYNGDVSGELKKMGNSYGDGIKRIMAVLYGEPILSNIDGNNELWDRKKISALVSKYNTLLPIAKAMTMHN